MAPFRGKELKKECNACNIVFDLPKTLGMRTILEAKKASLEEALSVWGPEH